MAAGDSIRVVVHAMRTIIVLSAAIGCLQVRAADWPQWLGPDRTGKAGSGESIDPELFRQPQALWKVPIGGGFSSPIVLRGRVIYLDEDGTNEVAHCVDAATGREIWKTSYANRFGDEWGAGPRSTPFSDGTRIYVQSCDGEFRCLDFETGKTLWGFNFESYGVPFLGNKAREGTASRRGNNGSGILDADSVIVPVGGNGAMLVCLDKVDGTLRWKSGDDEAAYSSLVVADIAGARQVIAFTADALTGSDRITGKLLWRVPLRTNAKRHAMTPVVDGNRIYVNSHTFGTIGFEIVNEDGEFRALEKWRNHEMKINLATPVLVDGYLFTHGARREFACIDAETGRTVWTQDGFGERLSSTIQAGRLLLVMTDAGEGVFVRPNGEKYEEILRVQLAGKNWNSPALGEGKLLVRDNRELACYRAK
jgi:outer membrane protein assembly factor BamB